MADRERLRELLSELGQVAHLDVDRIAAATEVVLESGVWQHFASFGLEQDRDYDDFDQFLRAESRLDLARFVALLRGAGYDEVAGRCETARREHLPKMVEKGGKYSNTAHPARETADAVIARLKRDDPELAAHVIAGDLTPHAAAVQSGIRRPRASFATNDVILAVAALLRHYDKNEILGALS